MKIGNYEFDGPWSLEEADLLDRACVYMILCKRADGKYDPIYVGETGQVGTRLSSHEKYSCWARYCSSSLYVVIFWTPSDRYAQQDRRNIERELIDQYDPPCNRQ